MHNLHDRVRAVVNQAFPAGIPFAKGDVECVQGSGPNKWASEIYEVKIPFDDAPTFKVEVRIVCGADDVESLKVNFVVPDDHGAKTKEGYVADTCELMQGRLLRAFENPVDPEIYFDLHSFLRRLASTVGAKRPRERFVCGGRQTFNITGPGGRLRIGIWKGTAYIRYSSGPSQRTDKILTVDHTGAESYIKIIQKAADISKVWHLGAMTLVKQHLDSLPIDKFQHPVLFVDAYSYSNPFCDVVFAAAPSMPVLRVFHDGILVKHEAESVYIKAEEFNTDARTDCVLENRGWRWWPISEELLFTPGTFEPSVIGVKFIPTEIK